MQILVGQYALALIKSETQGEKESTSKREVETGNLESTDRMLITQVTNVALVQGWDDTTKSKQHLFSRLVFGKQFQVFSEYKNWRLIAKITAIYWP